jgi:hypothetical protein
MRGTTVRNDDLNRFRATILVNDGHLILTPVNTNPTR